MSSRRGALSAPEGLVHGLYSGEERLRCMKRGRSRLRHQRRGARV